jgi:aminopeptidase
VCTLDYARMADAMEPLKQRMQRTDRVRLKGPGTDLSFSIKDIGVVPCEGRRNLPDGECFTAPVRDSVNGTITYNTPSLYLGTTFEDLSFTFEGGRIVRAEGEPHERLDALLDTDEGARYIGEFSLGLQSVHPASDEGHAVRREDRRLTPLHAGSGVRRRPTTATAPRCTGTSCSSSVPSTAAARCGSTDEPIRRDGRFVVPDLEPLNPERLAR